MCVRDSITPAALRESPSSLSRSSFGRWSTTIHPKRSVASQTIGMPRSAMLRCALNGIYLISVLSLLCSWASTSGRVCRILLASVLDTVLTLSLVLVTSPFDWSIISGKRKFRWPMICYFISRVRSSFVSTCYSLAERHTGGRRYSYHVHCRQWTRRASHSM
jgi:hypothetical protein